MRTRLDVSFQDAYDATLAVLRAQCQDKWLLSPDIIVAAAKVLDPDSNHHISDKFAGQVKRALAVILKEHPGEFVKVEAKSNAYPVIEATQVTSFERGGAFRQAIAEPVVAWLKYTGLYPVYTTMAHHEAAYAAYVKEQARLDDTLARAKAVEERLAELGIPAERRGLRFVVDDLLLTRLANYYEQEHHDG